MADMSTTSSIPALALPTLALPSWAPQPLPSARGAQSGEHGLSDTELADFHANGYVIKRGLFSSQRMTAVAQEIEGLHELMQTRAAHADVHVSWEESTAADRPRRIRQLLGSEIVSPLIDALSRSEEMLAIMRQLIGEDVWLYHSKLMMKAAHDGSFTPWHQDFQYWTNASPLPTQINCMLSIDASDEANGALRMVPGTHQGGLLPAKHFATASFNIGLEGALEDFPSVLLETKPGDAVIFGAYVIHGSGPNTSQRDRRANTFAFDRADNWLPGCAPVDDGDHYRCGARR